MRRFVPALGCALPLLFSACDLGTTEPAAPAIDNTAFAPGLGVDLAASTRTSSGLYYRDLMLGTGAVVSVGDSISVHYVGSFTSGTTFDQNVPGNAPLRFRAGRGQLIAGFDEGVIGMRVGGRRQLIIPPSLGYGSQPYQTIPGNSILVFAVEVVAKH